jgi:hypothetical protein
MPFSPQRFTHRGACFCLGYGIEVAVDVGVGAHIAVSEPYLNLIYTAYSRLERLGTPFIT